ncbi:phosphodiester glycosidase family protein [Amycolatopsis sp. K13G38]|uniref:Phosphodiester glycosidase family protein n=1 Tax=Amycolatopsis acididurans TaxID=2724524 RepID=A0ABX1J850_9PSEU|nr:phosphodiester glycosidase family protein [Amycolatopsis acididurans]NKQ55980.1 phosphodiester glycosidase family protein [Amycolatopsis acididurans]
MSTSTDLEPVTPPRRPRRSWARWLRRSIVGAALVFLVVVGISITGALTAPGTDSVAARLAEWGRDHGLGGAVTWLEKQQYAGNQPAVGGLPAGGIPVAPGAVPVAPAPSGTAAHGLPAPAPILSLAGAALLPGEGQWQTVVTDHSQPAVRVASLRPDGQHTSFVAGVMWIDPTLVRGQLQPGFQDPGGSWPEATSITPALQHSVAAAFNAGFRLNGASHGGYYSDGRTAVPLVDGAASLVMRTDGTATVGSWNREIRMSPQVASVRQNLVMLVDNGQVNPTCATGGTAEWGSTIGQAAYIHRSAFGVTADGAEVYVGGPALSVCTLGNILQAAGVVRGMELDINPAWVSGTYFHDSPTGPPKGFQLFPAEQVPPEHYLHPASRDWFGWYLRP